MLAQASPWHAHAAQRTAAGLAEPLSVPARMEWTTRPGQGPGADALGADLRGKRLLELGCGPGHNAAHLATRHGAHVTGVDLVGLQVRRARSHYGRLNNLTFVAGHALHYLHASDEQFDAIYSVFGAIGLVAPELLLPAIAQRLTPGRVLVFSVPHPQRGGRSSSGDDRPRRDHVTLPDRTRLPIARWDFATDRWERHLSQAGFWLNPGPRVPRPPHGPLAYHPADPRPQALTSHSPRHPLEEPMRPPYLLLDIDGVLIPFPDAAGSAPATHARHDVVPTGRSADNPVTVWLNPGHGRLLMDVIRTGLVTPVWCTSWRQDATTLIGPLLDLPALPHVDLPRPQITTSHPNGSRRLDRRRLHQPRPRLGGGAHRPRNDDSPRSARPTPRAAAQAPA